MGRGAVNAGIGVTLLALATLGCSGCAAIGPPWRSRGDRLASPPSAECQELSQQAQAAIDGHDDATALALLQRLVYLSPRSAEAHHRLGRVLQTQGRLPEAGAAYRRALELDKEYVGAMVGLGSIDAASGRPEAALKWFDQAIEIDPRQGEAHLARARALEALARPDDALAAYFRALEYLPSSTEARLQVASLQLVRSQPDQALARLDPLVEQNPDDAEARHARGRAHLALGHLVMACDDLNFAASKLPDRPDVYYHLALALAARQQTGPALQAARRALQLAPGNVEARNLTEKLLR